MKDTQDKETGNRILELERKVIELERRIVSLEGKQVTMREIEEDMQLTEVIRQVSLGNKGPLKEWNRKHKTV